MVLKKVFKNAQDIFLLKSEILLIQKQDEVQDFLFSIINYDDLVIKASITNKHWPSDVIEVNEHVLFFRSQKTGEGFTLDYLDDEIRIKCTVEGMNLKYFNLAKESYSSAVSIGGTLDSPVDKSLIINVFNPDYSLLEINDKWCRTIGDFILSINPLDRKISKYNLDSGNVEWQFPYDYYEITGGKVEILCVFQLQIVLQIGGEIFAINKGDGRVIWRISEIYDMNTRLIAWPFEGLTSFTVDRNKGIIYILQGFLHAEIDLNVGVARILFDFGAKEDKYHFYRASFDLDNSVAYFIADKNYENKMNLVGAYDLSRQRILWIQETQLPKGVFFSKKPLTNGNVIFLQDSMRNLYIYDINENI